MYYSDGDVDNVEVYACVGVGRYGKSLYFLLNFAVNLKLQKRNLLESHLKK